MSDLKIVWFLRVSGSQCKFFEQKSDLNMQFGCIAQKLMHYSGLWQLLSAPTTVWPSNPFVRLRHEVVY